jgi:hypothetical protein
MSVRMSRVVATITGHRRQSDRCSSALGTAAPTYNLPEHSSAENLPEAPISSLTAPLSTLKSDATDLLRQAISEFWYRC